MINYLKKILTGYHTERKRVNGIEYTFVYSDKPVFFDPVGMIKEFREKTSQESLQRLAMRFPFSESLSDIAFPKESDKPNVICYCSKSGKDLKVSRFSLKDGIYPLSYYRFELDGNLVGTFRRKYDYGSQIQEVASKISSLGNSTIDVDKENWLWESEHGEQLYLEKFGHSQIWFIKDSSLLELMK